MLRFSTSVFVIVMMFTITGANASPPLSSKPKRASFGQACNTTLRCDPRGWLGCYNGECNCIKPEEMIYEEDLRKCVSKSGERCAFALDDVADKNFIMEVTGCVSGAKCSPDGVCECGSKFYENANETCSPALGHLEVCDSGAQCSGYQALDCKDGVCRCDESKAIYSYDVEDQDPQCVGLAGSPCINSKCVANANCSESICVCNDEFYKDDTGFCLLQVEWGGNCTESNQCMQPPGQKLICLNGQCECDPKVSTFRRAQASQKQSEYNGDWGYNMYFRGFIGEIKSQCVGLASFPCIDRLCGVNAFCFYPTSRDAEGQEGTCKCMDGNMESKSHFCGTGYQTSCSSTSTCFEGLICKNSHCHCPFITQVFESFTNTCTSQIGGPCESNLSCGQNAECKIEKASGHCACRSGYVENTNGKCEAGYGTNCTSPTDCDSIAGLQCIDSKCRCDKFSDFNPTVRKCVGLVGAKCNPKEENECVENAYCKRVLPFALPGSCMCQNGFEESADYKCKADENRIIVTTESTLNEF